MAGGGWTHNTHSEIGKMLPFGLLLLARPRSILCSFAGEKAPRSMADCSGRVALHCFDTLVWESSGEGEGKLHTLIGMWKFCFLAREGFGIVGGIRWSVICGIKNYSNYFSRKKSTEFLLIQLCVFDDLKWWLNCLTSKNKNEHCLLFLATNTQHFPLPFKNELMNNKIWSLDYLSIIYG